VLEMGVGEDERYQRGVWDGQSLNGWTVFGVFVTEGRLGDHAYFTDIPLSLSLEGEYELGPFEATRLR
jgi:hypothetical protein